MAQSLMLVQTDRDVVIALGLRYLLRDAWAARADFTYVSAADCVAPIVGRPVTSSEVEKAVKADVRTRWALHLPQLFRPGYGAGRNDPNRGAGVISCSLRARGLEHGSPIRDHSPTEATDLTQLVSALDFIEFQRFCAVLLDRLGMYVRYYGIGYRRGADAIVARIDHGKLENIVVEAKTGSTNHAPSGARQVRRQKYLESCSARRSIVMTNTETKHQVASDGSEIWGLSKIVEEMCKASIGLTETGAVDRGFFRDLWVYFGAY